MRLAKLILACSSCSPAAATPPPSAAAAAAGPVALPFCSAWVLRFKYGVPQWWQVSASGMVAFALQAHTKLSISKAVVAAAAIAAAIVVVVCTDLLSANIKGPRSRCALSTFNSCASVKDTSCRRNEDCKVETNSSSRKLQIHSAKLFGRKYEKLLVRLGLETCKKLSIVKLILKRHNT